MSYLTIFLASTGCFLLYLGFAWTIAHRLQTVRRRYPLIVEKRR